MSLTEKMLCYKAEAAHWFAEGEIYYTPDEGVDYGFMPDGSYDYYDRIEKLRAPSGTYVVGEYYDITFDLKTNPPQIQRDSRVFVAATRSVK